ncbi:hypothetical protein [Blastomonas sp.]|uniref:hypothetical protein n=1 Tax=Blastomonas sp. TaxID=1909299 RepID=UPI00359440DA
MELSALVNLRMMYGAAVVGAGLVGAITLIAPSTAGRYIFAEATEIDVFMRILGALWLAIGLVAVAGFSDPVRYLPVLLIQLVYKSAWLAFAAYPALASGKSSAGLIALTLLFTMWVLALAILIPFRALMFTAI